MFSIILLMEVEMKKYLIPFLAFFLIIACSGDKEETKEANKTKEAVPQTQNLSIQFDVDSLIGKRISEIKKILGPPSAEFIPNKAQLKLDPKMVSSAEWHKNGVGISIDFKGDQKINYIFVSNDISKYTKQELIKVANLNPYSKRYVIKEQSALRGQGITGLHVCVERSCL